MLTSGVDFDSLKIVIQSSTQENYQKNLLVQYANILNLTGLLTPITPMFNLDDHNLVHVKLSWDDVTANRQRIINEDLVSTQVPN